VMTLPGDALVTHRTEVRRSRFLTTLRRVDDEPAARAVIDRVRRDFPDARHHCSAVIVAEPGRSRVERSNDDGEPAGTAGLPMLDVLRASGLVDVAAVVTRWFGGILLGTGGLARAYADAVSQALADAPRVRLLDLPVLEVELSSADAGRVEAGLRARGVPVLGAVWGAGVVMRVTPADEDDAGGDALSGLVSELSGGRAVCHRVGMARREVDVP